MLSPSVERSGKPDAAGIPWTLARYNWYLLNIYTKPVLFLLLNFSFSLFDPNPCFICM
jgi:hypothetical protein